jgi:hypothetical protein
VLAALRDGIVSPKTLSAPPSQAELGPPPTSELVDGTVPISLPSVTERTTQLIGDNTKQKP